MRKAENQVSTEFKYHIAGNFWRDIFSEISEIFTLSKNLFPENFCVSVGNERL